MSTKNLFDADYYERGLEKGISGYSNYRWMPELTIPMCATLNETLGITRQDRILDFGCAKGYAVRAFRLLYRQAWGYDISPYAVQAADTEVRKFVSNKMPSGTFDWVIAKDVFEHIDYNSIEQVIQRLSAKGKKLFCVVPLGADGKFVVPSYDLDMTHRIREPLTWWISLLTRNGFDVRSASYAHFGLKMNYAKWKLGNGFIVAQSTAQSLSSLSNQLGC